MSRIRWIAAGIVLAFILGFGVYACRERQVVSQTSIQANQHHEQGVIDDAQGAVHDQAAEAQKPILKADAETVARLRAEVARLRAASARPASVPSSPEDPTPQSVGAPVETPLEAAKDQLIDALTKENTDLKVQVENYYAESKSYHAASDHYKQETASLRTIIQTMPRPRPRAIGMDYGTNNTLAVWVERDFGPIRTGASVMRRQIPSINQTTVEAVVRLGVTF